MKSSQRIALGVGALLPLLVLGFWPRYFADLTQPRPAIHWHAALAYLWVAVLVCQALLVGRGMLRWHRFIGWAALGLAAALVWTSLGVARAFARAGPLDADRLQNLALPVGGLLVFAVAVAMAIRHRRNRDLHARWMAVTALGLAGAALHRVFLFYIPGFGTPMWAGHGCLLVLEATCAVTLAYEADQGRVRPPFAVALGMLTANHAVFAVAPTSTVWRTAAESLAALPAVFP